MLLKKILSDPETNLLQRENSVLLCIDWDPIENIVTHVNYVHVLNGRLQMVTDITNIFIEQLNGDAIINAIDWREESNVEAIELEN